MTDLSPDVQALLDESYKSDLTEEESEELLLLCGHGIGPQLSPAALAVLDAFENASEGEYVEGVWVVNERTMLSAALRAAVDLVVPDKCPPIEDFNEFDQGYAVAHIAHRADFLAIVTELEGL